LLNHLPILIIIFPLSIAFIILLFKKHTITLSIVSIVFSLASLLKFFPFILNGDVILYHLGGWQGTLGINLVIDGLSFFFAFIALAIGIMVILYSIPEKRHNHTYYFLLLLLLSSMVGTIFTADIFNMYILYDLVAIATYLLIAYYQQGVALKASFNYLLMSAVGLSLFLLGVGSLYAMSSTLHIASISEQLPAIFADDPQIIIMSLVLVITSMGIKMAMVPLHGWLPDAHSLAPSPVSAILSGVVVKVGLYCLIRLIFSLFSAEKILVSIGSHYILMGFGAISLLFGAMMALTQTDLKRMLAYSTINQVGLILIGLGINIDSGFEGALFHVLNHALLKSALFFCAGIVILQTGKRKIHDLAGYGEKNPLVAFCFVVLSLGVIGIPPMNGFVSKFLICLAAIEAKHSILALVIIFASLITAAYYFRVIQVFYSEPIQSHSNLSNIDVNENSLFWDKYFRLWPIYILTGFSLMLGIFPSLGLSLIKPAVKILLLSIAK
jgi:multicomponent Na+:H+ antiporter subunit D